MGCLDDVFRVLADPERKNPAAAANPSSEAKAEREYQPPGSPHSPAVSAAASPVAGGGAMGLNRARRQGRPGCFLKWPAAIVTALSFTLAFSCAAGSDNGSSGLKMRYDKLRCTTADEIGFVHNLDPGRIAVGGRARRYTGSSRSESARRRM